MIIGFPLQSPYIITLHIFSFPRNSFRRNKSSLMAVPSSYNKNKLIIAAILISFIEFHPSKPAGLEFPSYKTGSVNERKKLLQVGSRPPACVNKCSNCRPCMATLVIQPPDERKRYRTMSRHDEVDTYYLLSWKCKCGNKLYRP